MDNFVLPSNYCALNDWLFSNCDNDTLLVLSVDNYVFGSLLNSRQNDISVEQAIQRMNTLKLLSERFPKLKIYAFNVLMRTSISTLSADAITNWTLVNEYSQLVHKIQLWDNKADKERLAILKTLIPAEIMDTFNYSRKRNNLVNCMAIEFVHKEIFDNLSILQEDSTKYGTHKFEQSTLIGLVDQHNLHSRVHIHNGTDEAGSVTIAKAIAEVNGLSTELSFMYLNDNRDSFIASYEDRLFHQNLISQSKTAGIKLSDNTDLQDILVIYTPKNEQFEASLGDGTPPCDYTLDELDLFAKIVASLIKKGKRIYFLDVAYANGGQGDILRAMHRYFDVTKLHGYSAWNTASNSLGTILAQIILCKNAKFADNNRFTLERLLDDFAYQGVVRKRLQYQLLADGEDTLNLKNKCNADKKLQHLMEDFIVSEEIFNTVSLKIICELPWPRIFEAKILLGN